MSHPYDDGPPIEPWNFESTLVRPDGIRIHVAITVPARAAWQEVAETSEIAQMAANHARVQINRSTERPPF